MLHAFVILRALRGSCFFRGHHLTVSLKFTKGSPDIEAVMVTVPAFDPVV